MKSHSLTMIMAVVVAVGLQSIVLASGWNRSVTITSLGENNVSARSIAGPRVAMAPNIRWVV